MLTPIKNCPDSNELENFLLGKLSPTESQSFETHLSDCTPCLETLRSIKASDTLTEMTQKAWPQPATQEQEAESQFVRRLIDRVSQIAAPKQEGHLESNTDTDRAAEVQRLLEASEHESDLGRLGQYRIVELLGAGSSGVVYKAIDELLDRTVALKILRPSLGTAARVRFIAEAKATAAINHANVITIFNVGDESSLAYIAMEWIPGQTLEQLLVSHQSLPIESVKKLGKEIAAGLQAAHQRNLIHRDIKPANIWIADDGSQAKILDFGLVRVNDENPQLTCTGMIAGTPCFMSPEQSRGGELDHRSDLFSLACLLYQSLTGQLPFHANNALATLQAIQRDRPIPPSELDPNIPADLSDLVMCLLEKSPAHRPDSASEVMNALEQERSHWPFAVKRYASVEPKETKPLPNTGKFSRWFIGAAIALMMAAAAYAYGPQIVRIATNQGQIVIEANNENSQIEILENGERVRLVDIKNKTEIIEIKAGQYEVKPFKGDQSVTLDKGKLTLTRGGKAVVKVMYLNKADSTEMQLADESANDEAGPSSPRNGISSNFGFANQRRSNNQRNSNFRSNTNAIDSNHGYRGLGSNQNSQNRSARNSLSQKPNTQAYGSSNVRVPVDQAFNYDSPPSLGRGNRSNLNQRNNNTGLAGPEPPSMGFDSNVNNLRSLNSQRNPGDGRVSNSIDPSAELTLPRGDQAVYQGSTYSEWLRTAKRERETKKLIPAVEGLMALANESQRPEAIDTCVKIFRRGNSFGHGETIGRFAALHEDFVNELSEDELFDLYINELKYGTEHSLRLLRCTLEDNRTVQGKSRIDKVARLLFERKEEFTPVFKDFWKKRRTYSDTMTARILVTLIIEFFESKDAEVDTWLAPLRDVMLEEKYESFQLTLASMLIERQFDFDETVPVVVEIMSSSNSMGDRIRGYQILESVPEEHLDSALPEMIRFTRQQIGGGSLGSTKTRIKFLSSLSNESLFPHIEELAPLLYAVSKSAPDRAAYYSELRRRTFSIPGFEAKYYELYPPPAAGMSGRGGGAGLGMGGGPGAGSDGGGGLRSSFGGPPGPGSRGGGAAPGLGGGAGGGLDDGGGSRGSSGNPPRAGGRAPSGRGGGSANGTDRPGRDGGSRGRTSKGAGDAGDDKVN